MNYTLILHPLAEEDISEAYNWYEDKLGGLGERFLAELVVCYTKLESHPERYGKSGRSFRKIILNHFPYSVVYEIAQKRVIVYAVFHFSRNPKQVSKRKST